VQGNGVEGRGGEKREVGDKEVKRGKWREEEESGGERREVEGKKSEMAMHMFLLSPPLSLNFPTSPSIHLWEDLFGEDLFLVKSSWEAKGND
jgi:hypothetical protein